MPSLCRKLLSDFKLQHDRPTDFVHSVVCDSPIPYAIGVTCISIYTVTMAIYSGLSSAYGEKIFIWLTYWCFFTLTARFLVTAFNVWVYVFRQRTSRRMACNGQGLPEKPEGTAELPTLYKVQWALQNISGCSAIMVTALYWTIMYKPNKIESARSINSHALNSFLVLADLLLSRAPMRVHHFLYTFLFVLAYVIFTVVYWAAGGQNHLGQDFTYPLLNYSEHPGRAALVMLVVMFVGTPLLQLVLYAIFRIRQWACGRCLNHRSGTVTQVVVVDARSASPKDNVGKSDKRFSESDKRLSGVDKRLSKGDKRLSESDKRLSKGDKRFSESDKRLNGVDKRLSGMESDLSIDGPNSTEDHCEFRGRNYTLTSDTDDGEAVIDVDLDFEMDESHVFRPVVLQSNTSEVSCTDSTKALLN